jgi:hypothetical protein
MDSRSPYFPAPSTTGSREIHIFSIENSRRKAASAPRDVRYGSLADISNVARMSALPPKADISSAISPDDLVA